MAGPDTNPKPDDKAGSKLTAVDAAKRVKRTVAVTDDDGKVTAKDVAVKPAEVLSFKDYGTHVVVVTVDGQKFTSAE